MKKGFTLIEILIVFIIIVLLATLSLLVYQNVRERLYLSTAKANFRSLNDALQSYIITNEGVYPPDVGRSVPPELATELKNTNWPNAPWPDSVYDWENWTDPSTGEPIYQFSIRFCEYGDSSNCKFPDTEWAEDFDYFSSVYFCVKGDCRSHINKPANHPGYCVNCTEQ